MARSRWATTVAAQWTTGRQCIRDGEGNSDCDVNDEGESNGDGDCNGDGDGDSNGEGNGDDEEGGPCPTSVHD